MLRAAALVAVSNDAITGRVAARRFGGTMSRAWSRSTTHPSCTWERARASGAAVGDRISLALRPGGAHVIVAPRLARQSGHERIRFSRSRRPRARLHPLLDDADRSRYWPAQRGRWAACSSSTAKDLTPGCTHRGSASSGTARRPSRKPRHGLVGERHGADSSAKFKAKARARPPRLLADPETNEVPSQLRRMGREEELRQDLLGHPAGHLPARSEGGGARLAQGQGGRPRSGVLEAVREFAGWGRRVPETGRRRSWGETSDAVYVG